MFWKSYILNFSLYLIILSLSQSEVETTSKIRESDDDDSLIELDQVRRARNSYGSETRILIENTEVNNKLENNNEGKNGLEDLLRTKGYEMKTRNKGIGYKPPYEALFVVPEDTVKELTEDEIRGISFS